MLSLSKKTMVVFVFVFVALAAVFFPISFNFVLLVCFLFWVVGVFFIPSSLFVSRFYWFIFGIFFILPVVFLGGSEYLLQGAFLTDIYLTDSQAILLIRLVLFHLVFFMLATFLVSDSVVVKNIDYEIRNIVLFYFLLIVTAVIVLGFNLLEMNAVYTQGYAAFQSDELSVKKNFFILLVEFLFLSLVSLGMSKKKYFCFFLLMIYSFSLIFTGIRMPGACLAFFAFLHFFTYWRSKFILVMIATLIMAPPVLMFTQSLRVYGYSALDYFDLAYGYFDLIRVLGYTVDTLKAVVSIGDVVDVSPFFKLFQILTIFLDRVFSVEVDFGYKAFAPEFTKYYDLDLFERTGTTFGSASVAEAWYYWGWGGVALVGSAAFFISCWFSKIAYSGGLVLTLIYLVALPKFIISVRNEVLGWFFESAIHLLLCVPFVIFCYVAFVKKEKIS
ncbi:MAG: O-antigen polysaccharide polymerase Wzy [Motiliproteus sp.]